MAGDKEIQVAQATMGLAGHPALELLNTRAELTQGVVTDLISDGSRYVEWLARVGLVAAGDVAAVRTRFTEQDLERAVEAAQDLRTRTLPVVDAWISGVPLSDAMAAHLNGFIRTGGAYREVTRSATGPVFVERTVWSDWRSLVAPVAAAVADLTLDGNPDLVHQCIGETCNLWFYDRTKSHRRKWCSMSTCGNRTKVRAHRARAADQADSTG
ncbi:CGNR zinc finger domain-containing protein [Streptomyces sp. NPDC057062]|uniref:CGNR zinc finger domain-containing protein n=1 Tax=Streptomyces sp. NPDC057062 TaxID=3346011 RepID=UPI00362C9B0D